MKLILIGIMLFFSQTNAWAADKSEIWELLQRIDAELRYYDQTPAQLNQSKTRLEEVLRLLRGGSPQDPSQCLEFVIGEFVKEGYSQSTAMQKAKSVCNRIERDGSDFPVVNFCFDQLKLDGYSTTTAFEVSVDLAKQIPEGGLSCVKPAYERYKKDGYSNRTALNNAVNFCKR